MAKENTCTRFYIGENLIEIWEETQTIRTTFPDGSELVAAPQKNREYKEQAFVLGYTDVWEMCKSHEILHTAIAVGKGKPYSRGLWRAGNSLPADNRDFEEESEVLRVQTKALK